MSISSMIQSFCPNFELPECYDCGRCAARDYCNYRELRKIEQTLHEAVKANPIDQLSVRKVLP
jgi:hypothetical protein